MLSDAQTVEIARIERRYGAARIIPPGPRRDRLLGFYGTVGVAVTTSDGCLCCNEVFVIGVDGDCVEVEAA